MSASGTGPELRVLQNVRDVGGLSTTDGGRVRSGVLYRSDAPLDGDGPPPLTPWPPQQVVDLRATREAAVGPHPLAGGGAEILSLPLMPAADPRNLIAAADREALSLATIYADMLTIGGPVIAEIAGLIAVADGPVLVHCAVGKDRTGVAIGVLLAAVGVTREDILRDYAQTEQHVEAVIARMVTVWSADERDVLQGFTIRHAHLMRAPAEALATVLDALDAWPGGAAGWLAEHGTSAATLAELRERLIDD